MDKNILISVVTTCYNQGHFMEDALKSIVTQSHTNWEWIVVDDCSTDNSVKVINNLIKKYNVGTKTKVFIHTENKGYGSSLEEAITKSSGELVAVVDSDDALASDKALEIERDIHIERPDAALVYSNYIECNRNLKPKKVYKTRALKSNEKYLGTKIRISHFKMLKKKHYDMTDGINPKLRQSVDKDLNLRLEEVGKLIYVDADLMYYRHHSENLSRSISKKNVKYRNFITKMRKQIYIDARKRRDSQKNRLETFKLKIFVDGSKRAAVNRMFPVWRALGHEIVNDPKEANVQLSVIKISNKNELPTVLRLDGVYYDLADNYKSRNVGLSKAHEIADAIIYQSETSKKMCEKYLSKRKTSIFEVIYNGIDENQFVFKKHKDLNIVTCAKWRRCKRLPEIIEIFNKFLSKRKHTKLHIIGPMYKGAKEIPCTNVVYHGQMNFNQIKSIYEIADIYLHLAKKDSCPSSVVEAVGAGIPVITTDACGGATEMCKLTEGCVIINGEEKSFEPDYIYQKKYNMISREIRDAVICAMIDIEDKNKRIKIPKELTIEYVAKQYLDVMKQIVKER